MKTKVKIENKDEYPGQTDAIAKAIKHVATKREQQPSVVALMKSGVTIFSGWKQAGLTFQQMADILGGQGIKVSGEWLRKNYNENLYLANDSVAKEIAKKITCALLTGNHLIVEASKYIEAEPSIKNYKHSKNTEIKSLKPHSEDETPVRRGLTASSAKEVNQIPFQVQSLGAEVSSKKPFTSSVPVTPPVKEKMVLVPIPGEDEDVTTRIFETPYIFGDMRRRLYNFHHGEPKADHYAFDDGNMYVVSPYYHHQIISGKIRNWEEFFIKTVN